MSDLLFPTVAFLDFLLESLGCLSVEAFECRGVHGHVRGLSGGIRARVMLVRLVRPVGVVKVALPLLHGVVVRIVLIFVVPRRLVTHVIVGTPMIPTLM